MIGTSDAHFQMENGTKIITQCVVLLSANNVFLRSSVYKGGGRAGGGAAAAGARVQQHPRRRPRRGKPVPLPAEPLLHHRGQASERPPGREVGERRRAPPARVPVSPRPVRAQAPPAGGPEQTAPSPAAVDQRERGRQHRPATNVWRPARAPQVQG